MAHQRRVGARQAYRSSVKTTTAKILQDNDEGRLWHIDGANGAINKRNTLLLQVRDITSPVGLLIARQIKPAGGTVEDYSDRNARMRYCLNYDEITQDAQRKQIGLQNIRQITHSLISASF